MKEATLTRPEPIAAQKTRIAYLDLARVISVFAVVMIHTAAQQFYTSGVYSYRWMTLLTFDAALRWAVPVFVMISGALFLERETPVSALFRKYIPRLAVAFLFWNGIYALLREDRVGFSLSDLLTGTYHLWFIPMMIGLYLALPVLQAIVRKPGLCRYFLILSAVFSFALPQAISLWQDFCQSRFPDFPLSVLQVVQHMRANVFIGYPFYFVLGWVLNRRTLTGKQRAGIYLLGVFGFVSTVVLNVYLAHNSGAVAETYLDYFTVNVMLESVAVFTAFRSLPLKAGRWTPFLSRLSKDSFGVYLCHVLLLDQLRIRFGLTTAFTAAVISVPVIALAVTAGSFALSALLNRIPILRRWIV